MLSSTGRWRGHALGGRDGAGVTTTLLNLDCVIGLFAMKLLAQLGAFSDNILMLKFQLRKQTKRIL